MKKIPSLYKRNYEGDRLAYDEVVEGCEWVLAGEGVATAKWDGTATLVREGQLFKRYDRKLDKRKKQMLNKGLFVVIEHSDFAPAPDGWEACEPEPNVHTGHWPGWVPVDARNPGDKWFVEAWARQLEEDGEPQDGTYELIGPHFQGNPHGCPYDMFIPHGRLQYAGFKRDFETIKTLMKQELVADDGLVFRFDVEGLVFHHPDGRMCKVKKKDFGLPWPVEE
jgi:hypothetical protein